MNVEVDLKFVKSKGFHQYVKEGAELIAEKCEKEDRKKCEAFQCSAASQDDQRG